MAAMHTLVPEKPKPEPLRMTLAEPRPLQTVWLLWKDDHVLAIYGSEARARQECDDLVAAMIAKGSLDVFLITIEAREVHL